MKLILASTLLFTSMAFSAPNFGAFTDKNILYVTLLGDCNTASAGLVVNSLCNKNRMTRNYALECGMDLIVATTRMTCPTEEIVPKVFTFDLGKEQVAPEAEELEIKYQDKSVKLKVNK